MELVNKGVLQRFDDMLINLLGLRADYLYLPDDVIFHVLKKAQVDMIFVVEGFRRGSDVEVFK